MQEDGGLKRDFEKAHMGIIGLAPAPWFDEDDIVTAWPTGGYDSPLHACAWHEWVDGECVVEMDMWKRSGHTKAEWIALADEMIARWSAWKAELSEFDE
jgi:hypothetical protein